MLNWFLTKKKNSPSNSEKKKDDFVSLSSHELRSPLSIIKWYTEILLDGDAGPLTEDQRKYLTVIESSNQRAIDLVRSLLNVSRLDLGTFSILPEEVSLSTVISESISFFQKEAHKRNIEIIFNDIGPKLTLNVDKRICSLICKQLLSNAVSFSKNGSTVKVSTDLFVKGSFLDGKNIQEESVVLTVTDSGIGIPTLDHEKIFSKMFRARNVKDSEGTGSGLGLYITKTVIDIFGGDIWFTSQEGLGTTFYVTFPVKGMKMKEGTTALD